MKFINSLLTLTVALASVITVSAQSGYDYFAVPRTISLHTPQLISGGAAGPVTTAPVDTHGFEGIAKIDISSVTNAAGGTITLAIQTSPDTNTWTSLANAAYATPTTVNITNSANGFISTNTWLLPGVVTVPTAATAGFATSYILPASFTNTVSALTITANGVYEIAYNVGDAARYVRLIYTTGGTATNSTVSAVFTGRRAQ